MLHILRINKVTGMKNSLLFPSISNKIDIKAFVLLYSAFSFQATSNAENTKTPLPINTNHGIIEPMNKQSSENILNIEDLELYNKNKLWFVQNLELEIITIGINFKDSGDTTEPKELPGLCSLLTQILNDCGAQSEDRIIFRKKLLAHNIQIQFSNTGDSLSVIVKTPSKHLSYAMELLKQLLTAPKIDKAIVDFSKQRSLAQLQQSLHDPETIAQEKFKSYIFGNDHPYSKNIQSKIDTILKATQSDIELLFKKVIKNTSVDVAGCGNSNANQLKIYIDDILNLLTPDNIKNDKPNGELLNAGKIEKITSESPQSVVLFSHPGISKDDPDHMTAQILIAALGKTPFESRLWHEVREKRGLSYGVRLDLFTSTLKYALTGYLATVPTSVDKAIEVIKDEWAKVAKDGITEEELSLQKQYLIDGYPMHFNTSSDIVGALLEYMNQGYSKTYPQERIHKIQEITLEMVNNFAKKYLKPELLTFVVYGKNG